MRSPGATRCLTGPIIKDLYLFGMRAAQEWRCDAQQYWVLCARINQLGGGSFASSSWQRSQSRPRENKHNKNGVKTGMSRRATLKMTSQCNAPLPPIRKYEARSRWHSADMAARQRCVQINPQGDKRHRKIREAHHMCACVSVFVCARLKSLTLPFRICSDREEGGKNMFPSCTKRKKKHPQVSSACASLVSLSRSGWSQGS